MSPSWQDGSLVYSAANICIHFFTFEFLDRVVSAKEKFLHHHVAKKKIPYVNEAGAAETSSEIGWCTANGAVCIGAGSILCRELP
jgi:hypothetical protein